MTYFYDEQIRRYLLQFLRIFSDVKVRTAPNENGFQLETRVPIKYGDMSRLVASIINQNTENVVISAPSMAANITGLKLDNKRRSDTMLVSKVHPDSVKFNNQTQEYENEQGNRYTVERYMPVPYIMTMQLDILTTNTDNKLQIWEQISTIFNPSIQLQQHDNPLDWTRVFEVELTDTTWTNRAVPAGSTDDYDTMSLEFKIPIWVNPPAQEKRQRIIEKIITRVFDTDDEPVDGKDPFDIGSQVAQMNVTGGNFKIQVTEDPTNPDLHIATLLNKYGVPDDLSWESEMGIFGQISPDYSLLRLKTNDDIESTDGDIFANVVSLSADPSQLIVQIDEDTLPPTISSGPVNSIIDPTINFPGESLPVEAAGQRYLLILENENTDDPAITPFNNYWGGLTAHENDIIEYTGTQWVVVFDSTAEVANQYVVSLSDKQQYKFTGNEWIYTYLGTYEPVYWELENLNILDDGGGNIPVDPNGPEVGNGGIC